MTRSLAGLLLLSILATGCARHEPGRTVFALFDQSGSTSGVRERYVRDFARIAESLRGGDRIVVDYITESPLAQSSFPVNEIFPRFDPVSHNRIIYDRDVGVRKEGVLQSVRALVMDTTRRTRSTRVLEALELAERVFATYSATEKILVLFSDMVEESEAHDFRTARLDDQTTEEIISDRRARGRLPDLSGVKVYVVGASGGVYEAMALDRRDAIRSFWIAFFAASGADLGKERYGASLLEFEPEEKAKP